MDENGEIEWRAPKRKQATGSYEKKISIKSAGSDGQGNATHLWVSGNPSKFLQGHNVFGSDDLVSLVYGVIDCLGLETSAKFSIYMKYIHLIWLKPLAWCS